MTTTVISPATAIDKVWPPLPYAAWGDTCTTLQLWMQIVGKIRMELVPHINHSWNVTLYPTIRGVSTFPMAYGRGMLQIDFDFVDHALRIESSESGRRTIVLAQMSVAAFYRAVMDALDELHTPVTIWPWPMEVADPIRLDQDEVHRAYDAEYANRFWRVLLQTTRLFTAFRARFGGKVSPVHLFWGAMDLACTRFCGREAPEHPSMPGLPDRVTRDAYSHEVSSAGSGPAERGWTRCSTATHIPSRRDIANIASRPPRLHSAMTSASSSCPTKRCARQPTPTPRCWSSCRRHTRPRRVAARGIVRHSRWTRNLLK